MLHHAVSQKVTDVSTVLIAFITRAIIAPTEIVPYKQPRPLPSTPIPIHRLTSNWRVLRNHYCMFWARRREVKNTCYYTLAAMCTRIRCSTWTCNVRYGVWKQDKSRGLSTASSFQDEGNANDGKCILKRLQHIGFLACGCSCLYMRAYVMSVSVYCHQRLLIASRHSSVSVRKSTPRTAIMGSLRPSSSGLHASCWYAPQRLGCPPSAFVCTCSSAINCFVLYPERKF
jgi:hypothetical protein